MASSNNLAALSLEDKPCEGASDRNPSELQRGLRGNELAGVDFLSRSPSSALVPTFLGEGSPTKIDKTGKSWYQLLLTSQIWKTELSILFGHCSTPKTGSSRFQPGFLEAL